MTDSHDHYSLPFQLKQLGPEQYRSSKKRSSSRPIPQRRTPPLFEPSSKVRPQGLPAPPEPPAKDFSLDRRMLMRLGPPTLILFTFPLFLLTGNAPITRFVVDSGLFSGAPAPYMSWSGFYYLRLRRHMANTPTSKARSPAMGTVEIHGRAARKHALGAKHDNAPAQQAVIGRPEARGLPFVIAEAASEEKLTRKFGRFSALFFGADALAAGWTLYRIALVL